MRRARTTYVGIRRLLLVLLCQIVLSLSLTPIDDAVHKVVNDLLRVTHRLGRAGETFSELPERAGGKEGV